MHILHLNQRNQILFRYLSDKKKKKKEGGSEKGGGGGGKFTHFTFPGSAPGLLGLSVKFEIKQWFLAYKDQFCACFSLVRRPTETARVLFLSEPFSKRNSFIFLRPASRTRSMSRQDFFVPYLFTSDVKSCVCPLIDHRQKSITMRE